MLKSRISLIGQSVLNSVIDVVFGQSIGSLSLSLHLKVAMTSLMMTRFDVVEKKGQSNTAPLLALHPRNIDCIGNIDCIMKFD